MQTLKLFIVLLTLNRLLLIYGIDVAKDCYSKKLYFFVKLYVCEKILAANNLHE